MNKKFLGVGIVIVVSIIILISSLQFIEKEEIPSMPVATKTNEKFGLVINTPKTTTTLQELDNAYTLASSSGIGRSNVYMFWNTVEPEKGEFNWEPSDVQMSLNQKNDLKVTLYFSIINGKTLGPFPDWIGNPSILAISEENLVIVLDEILSRYDIVDTLIISGNTEVQFRYEEGKRNIPVYDELFQYVYQQIKEKHPDVKIGNAFSLNDVINKNLDHVVTELDDGDFVAFTYMPVDVVNEIVKAPQEAKQDFERILKLVPNNKIAFFEVGWSSSDFVGGNQEIQKQFVLELFDFYNENEEQFEFITWYRLYDRPEGTCKIISDENESVIDIGGGSGLGSNEFVIERLENYICQSGLYDENNSPKPAWNEFTNKIKSNS